MPQISIILSVYNTSKFLPQCLDSIVNQSFQDIEIICVNDGSTDNSLDILNEYAAKDTRITVINKENEGLGAASARNLGLSVAQGEYVSILDSDDFFEPEMLEKMITRAKELNSDIVVCGGMEYDHTRHTKIKTPSILNENVIPTKDVFSYKDCPSDIFQLSQGMAWNKLYCKKFLKKHNICFQKIKYTDDAYFTFAHMVLAEKIAVVNEPLAYYRINTGSNQTGGLAGYPESAYMPYLELKKSLIDWGIYETVKQSFVNCAVTFMRYCYDKVDSFEAFEFLHEKYRNEIFQQLNISESSKDYFYDERIYVWKKQITENSAGKLAFMAARSYGFEYTTASLRFQIPYKLIPSNSRIVIYGCGIMGKYIYAKIILSDYCDIALWCDPNNHRNVSYIHDISEIKNLDFDFVIIAQVQHNLVKNAVDYLNDIGVPNKKIILGGINS